jgi:CheY-like chemotaxis protein
MSQEIFVVDDDPDFQFIFFKLIKGLKTQYPVKFFENPRALYQHLKILQHKDEDMLPALIILDLNMPGMNGMQLLKMLRSARSSTESKIGQIPVVIMSGDIPNDQIQFYYEAGANAVLQKQPDFKVMKTTIQSVCNFWLERKSAYIPAG